MSASHMTTLSSSSSSSASCWMDGPLGSKALSFLAISGGSVSYTRRVMHLYCGIVVVVIIIHRHKLSLPERRGEERRGDSWQKRKKGFPHLIVVGYIYGLLGSKDDVFLALGYPKQPNDEPLMFWWQRQGISEKMLLLSAFHNAAAPPTMQSEVFFFKLKFVSKVRELLSAPAVPC